MADVKSGVSLGLDVTMPALKDMAAQLERLQKPVTPVLKAMGEYLLLSTLDRFEAAHAPDGSPWTPLSAGVAATKKGPGILRESLRLKESIHYEVSDHLEVGTNVVYAALHQFGGVTKPHVIAARRANALAFVGSSGDPTLRKRVNHPGSHMPARPYLGLSSADETELIAIMDDYLKQVLS